MRKTVLAVMLLMTTATPFFGSTTAQGWEGPMGFRILCMTTPSACRGGGPVSVDATPAIVTKLQEINSRINRSIRPKDDGRVDRWVINASSGDCEDYALSKRAALIQAGLPASSLRIAYVKTRAGQDHAILVVNTSAGKLVLDNLTSTISSLNQSRYRVISMQTQNPRVWS